MEWLYIYKYIYVCIYIYIYTYIHIYAIYRNSHNVYSYTYYLFVGMKEHTAYGILQRMNLVFVRCLLKHLYWILLYTVLILLLFHVKVCKTGINIFCDAVMCMIHTMVSQVTNDMALNWYETNPSVSYNKMTRVPLYWYGLILIPAWINNHFHYEVWDDITYPFLNFNGATVEFWEWICNFIPHFTRHVITYPCGDYLFAGIKDKQC